MKAAVLFSVPMTTSADVCWRWRSADGITDSTQSFSDYYDCFENAQASGYYVEAALQRANVAPAMRPTGAMRQSEVAPAMHFAGAMRQSE